jgi:large subunit ribosomal protein L7A
MAENLLGKIFVAADSDAKTLRGILETAASLKVEVEKVDSKLKLGRACAIDRPAAVAGLRRGGPA